MNAAPDKMNILNSFRPCLLLWIWLGIALPCFAQFGQVDPDFLVKRPANGRYTADKSINFIQATPEGKLLVAGSFNSIDQYGSGAIARINKDGSIDQTFLSPIAGSCSHMYQYPDGRILAVGDFTIKESGEQVGLIRLLTNGSLDPSFNNKNFFNYTKHIKFGVSSNGFILVGGRFDKVNVLTIKYLALFDSEGNLIDSPIHNKLNSYVSTITSASSNQFLLTGNFSKYGSTEVGNVIKISLNGDLVSSFENTKISGDIYTLFMEGQDIYIGGSIMNDDSLALLKLNFEGKIDTSFHLDLKPYLTRFSTVHHITKINTNEICIVGEFGYVNNTHQINHCRIDRSGNVLSNPSENIGIPNSLVHKNDTIYTSDKFGAINRFIQYERDTTYFYPVYPIVQKITNVELQSNDKIIVSSIGGPTSVFSIKHNGYIDEPKIPITLYHTYSNDKIKLKKDGSYSVILDELEAQYASFSIDETFNCNIPPFPDTKFQNEFPYSQCVVGDSSYVLFYNGFVGWVNKIDTNCDTTTYKDTGEIDFIPYKIYYSDPYFYILYSNSGTPNILQYDKKFHQTSNLFLEINIGAPPYSQNMYQINNKIYLTNLKFGTDTINYSYRYNLNGTIDSTFKKIPKTYAIAQHNDYLLVGGAFTEIQGKPYKGFARLHMDGSIDTTYIQHGGCNGLVRDIKVLSNGDIIVAGEFTEFDGYACNNIVKLSGQPNATYEPIGYTDEYTLYPNPATNQLTIQGNNQQSFSVNIYDSLGRLWLQTGKSNGQSLTIAIDQLPPMLYFVQSRADGKMIGKFVKQ